MTEPVEATVCYRHPGRRAGVSCQRCGRTICPDCMVQASVGFHCPECARQGAKRSPVITPRSLDTRPIVTQVLIAMNAAVLVLDLLSGGSLSNGQGNVYFDYALYGGYTTGRFGVAAGEWYRLISGGFVHAGILHLGMNMLVLWILGNQLERLLGHARYAALYLAALLAGSFAVIVVNPAVPTVGASGAIFGLMGAALAYQITQKVSLMQSGLAGLIFINLVITFAIPGISIAGHIGGLVGGFVTGWAMFQVDRRVRSEWAGVAVALGVAAVCALGAIYVAGLHVRPAL